MKKLLLILLCLGSLAWGQEAGDDNAPALTIYNQNFFVAREHLPMDLHSGVNQVAFAGIAAHLEADSVILRDPNGRALQILEQNYRNDPISQELLLSFYEGKTIDFLVQRGEKQEIVRGRIVRSGYVPSATYANGYPQPGYGQPIIEIDGVLRFGLPGQPLFPALSGDSILKPTLSWLIETNDPGKFDAEVSYVSGGMSWQSDYNLVVSDKSNGKFDVLDMVGWITMRNQSGKTFENARIKLLAGDVNKLQPGTVAGRMYRAESKAMAQDAMAPVVREKSFDEFHLYTLERATTLRDQQTKQVEFVRSTGIRALRLYVYDGAQTDYGYYGGLVQDPNYGTASNPKIWVMEEFKNSDTNHLGIPLPKGKLRFYRRDTDGYLEFVGENTIDHTPKDETIRVYTGNSFDIVGERKRTNFRVDSNHNWMEESFEIKVRNHKKEPVNVRVVEHLYRWTNWKLIEQSHDSRKMDAQTVEFPVSIAPDGEQVVTYTVHYSW
ncbi:MAG TPA: hypothetical protein VMT28_02120 [Terriglobales bacterium]|jgi:hypothetical protein|nr:hypothetical protein [Terriglobales bacterium]